MARRIYFAFAMAILATIVLTALLYGSAPAANAHFAHFTHYNNRGDQVGPYYAYEQLEPEYAGPTTPVAIMFSVQDLDGHDTYNIDAMVEVYSAETGERLKAFPWTKEDVGDFQVFYNFPKVGNYQIVLSVAKDTANLNTIDPPRSTLSGTTGCNCDRAIFNVSISNSFGAIWTTTMLVAVAGPLTVFGGVLAWNYSSRKKSGNVGSRVETTRYVIMLAAIAGGLVHLAVYSEHASLRIEYSIFLITAGGMQIVYGVVYTLLALTGEVKGKESSVQAVREYYHKTVGVNIFGLVGTGILLGLYAYAVIFPPPLSPNNQPEDVDAAGIIAKSIEVFTVIGILYLMRLEKRKLEQYLWNKQV
jgi:hypothetical protein